MNCNYIEENIIAYIENTLDERSVKAFDEHVKSCNNCKMLLRQVRQTYSVIDLEKKQAVPENSFENIMQEINKAEFETKYKIIEFVRPVLIAASIACGVVLGYNSYHTYTLDNSGYLISQDDSYYINDMAQASIEFNLLDE